MRPKALLTSVAALLAVGYAAGARAAPLDPVASDAVSVKVMTAGFNLDDAAGARIVLSRIRGAARQICGAEPTQREIAAHATYRACVKDAVDRAVAKTAHPLLATLNGTPRADAKLATITD